MPLQFVRGDATRPIGRGPKILAHICNDEGGWGEGFVLAISKRWREPEQRYTEWANGAFREPPFALGELLLVEVEFDLIVANMIAQHGLKPTLLGPPIRYAALHDALTKLGGYAADNAMSVHMPRIGCGLAGGTWDRVEPIVRETLVAKGVGVVVYDPE